MAELLISDVKGFFDIESGNLVALQNGNAAAPKMPVMGAPMTWASRPTPAAAGDGALQWFSDIGGGTLWRSNGTYWRPMNGSALLYCRNGSFATPVASLTGTGAAQNFTLPETLQIPAGLLFPGCKLTVEARIARSTVAGTAATARVRFGTANSTADGTLGFSSIAGAAATCWDARPEISVRTLNSQHLVIGAPRYGATATYLFEMAEKALDLSTLPYYVSFGADAALVNPDVFNLYGYQVAISG